MLLTSGIVSVYYSLYSLGFRQVVLFLKSIASIALFNV